MIPLERVPRPTRVTISLHDGQFRLEASQTGEGRIADFAEFQQFFTDASATARALEKELPVALAARDSAAMQHARASQFPLSLVLPSRSAKLRTAVDAAEQRLIQLAHARNACAVAVRFDLSGPLLDAFARLAEAHLQLAQVAHIWDIPADVPAAAVSTMPPRRTVSAAPFVPEFMVSRWPGLALQHAGELGVVIFPGFILSGAAPPADRTLITDLHAAVVEASEVRLQERETVPRDATVVDHVWDRANRDGSPDRRFTNNTRTPVVSYGLLRLTLGTSNPRAFLVSNRAAATRFAENFQAFQTLLRGTANPEPKDARGRDAWPDQSLDPVVRVPEAPGAGGAHELTAALVVALSFIGVTAWVPDLAARLHSAASVEIAAPGAPASVQSPDTTAHDRSENTSSQPQPQASASQVSSGQAVQSEPIRTSPPTPQPRRDQTVTRSGANVRNAPSGTAEVVRTVSAGTKLTVFSRAPGGWVQVGDTVPWGWVHTSLLGSVE